MQNNFYNEIIEIIKTAPKEQLKELLEKYHSSDIADVLETLTAQERMYVYDALGIENTADIVSYYENVEEFIEELTPEFTADLLEEMDSDDAVDVLNELDEEDKQEIIDLMEDEVKEIVQKLDSYDEDVIASYSTDNFVSININSTVPQAMASMIKQAGDHDNIFTIYVVDDEKKFVGAINLRDLIVSRKNDSFANLIMTSYPYFYEDELMSECIGRIKEYAETSLPILNHNDEIIGVITADAVIEATEDELSEDYAKLGGLTEEEELDEPIIQSIKKRIPWLIVLLFLGLIVSSVIGVFEAVISTIPVIVFFQTMILGMAGNVGTQSLALTIRNINDESFKNEKKKQLKSMLKEIRVGFFNGLIMGSVAFVFVLIYLTVLQKEIIEGSGFVLSNTLIVCGIIGTSMFTSIILSSFIGTAFPILLSKLGIDPAVASGPFITTLNDIVAVIVYFGLTYLMFMVILF